jgi:NADPH:quinone reductase-like Zn-dependent oxidoreductase
MSLRRSPAIPETDFSGTVIALGDAIPRTPLEAYPARFFDVGTPVFGSVSVSAHLKTGMGTLAEFVEVEMDDLARRPARVDAAEAAGVAVSGSTALELVDTAGLKEGWRALIMAPCGGIGSFVTQLVKRRVGKGGRVVGVCSAGKADAARALGCDEVVDYGAEVEGKGWLDRLAERFGEEMFDVVIDCHGSQELWHASPRFLKNGQGHSYTTVGVKFSSYTYTGVLGTVWKMIINASLPTFIGGTPRPYRQVASMVTPEKLNRLGKMMEDGDLRCEIGGRWSLENALDVSHPEFCGNPSADPGSRRIKHSSTVMPKES